MHSRYQSSFQLPLWPFQPIKFFASSWSQVSHSLSRKSQDSCSPSVRLPSSMLPGNLLVGRHFEPGPRENWPPFGGVAKLPKVYHRMQQRSTNTSCHAVTERRTRRLCSEYKIFTFPSIVILRRILPIFSSESSFCSWRQTLRTLPGIG